MKFESESVAVIGDENRYMPLSLYIPRKGSTERWEGAVNRMIRKPEDLPETIKQFLENRKL